MRYGETRGKAAFSETICGIAPWLALSGGMALAFCQWLIFAYAPVEASMRLPQKIFYLHLPLAWWGLASFFLVFLAGILYLRTRNLAWDALAGAAAEVGLALALLALVTGAIWGKPAWGTWWTWDARLSTTLIMCFVYAGYLIVRGLDLEPGRRPGSLPFSALWPFWMFPWSSFPRDCGVTFIRPPSRLNRK